MIQRAWKVLGFAVVLCIASSFAASVSAVEAEEIEQVDAEAKEEITRAHHGHVTLRDVLFGAERWQFWGAVVNFGLLVYLLRRLSKKPLDAFLSSRRETIERGISEAAEVKRAAEEAFTTYTERMQSLDAELTKLRKDVAEAAERDRARIVADANDGVARLKAETEALIQRQAEQLELQIRREVVSAAAQAAENAVRELTTAEDQQRLADAFMRELGKLAEGAEEKRA